MTHPTEQDWAIRAGIYSLFVEHARAPTYEEIAKKFDIVPSEAREAFCRLHEAHALFLEPGSDRIRLLNPFSAVETPFRVETDSKTYYANCAWDMLATPAMLGQDALIHARLEDTGGTIQIPVTGGRPLPDRDYIVNFSVPFRNWYNNLIHT